MTKVAVILAGCGYLDGAEIRESVITLLALDKRNIEVQIFAPDIEQSDVINHLTGQPVNEERNVLIEAARIARGKIKPLREIGVEEFDALILPGGYGVAKSLSNLATTDNLQNVKVLPDLKKIILDFMEQDKPIGAICISPAVLVAAVRDSHQVHVTIGDDTDGMIDSLGGIHQECPTRGIVIDDTNHIVSCSAYMREDRIAEVAAGIERLVEAVDNQVKHQMEVA